MKLSTINEVITRPLKDPDDLRNTASNTHSFFYTTISGLVVCKKADVNHADWYKHHRITRWKWAKAASPPPQTETNRTSGCYGVLNGKPIVAFWNFPVNNHLIRPCAQALLQYLPGETEVVLIGAEKSGITLGSIVNPSAGLPHKNRGYQYWQQRQTSESKQPNHPRKANDSSAHRS